MAKTKKSGQKSNVKKLTAQEFIQEFCNKQNELLMGMVQCIQAGELQLDSIHGDNLVDGIVEAWCDQPEPSYELHVQMIAAVTLWALMNQLEDGGLLDDDFNGSAARKPPPTHIDTDFSNHPGFAVTMEILKTVRSIWGKTHE